LLFITHNLLLVGSIADRVMVLQGGRIREEGAAADVLLAPEHPYTQSLIADMPQLADA
ncbi:MAG: peptide ABC transporter ATP-binding protein, partial [Solirubrobacterales bacterium]|nr:peptide ABC transporter ATP-binding protein [Solirubrobacterales bacterium]